MSKRKTILAGCLIGLGVMILGCDSKSTPSGDASKGVSAEVVRLQGAGASFPAPLYLKWFKQYSTANQGVQVDYQSVGSGSGVKSFLDGTVDFGASDAAMTEEEIKQAPKGVKLLPMTAGSIVLSYNIPNVESLKLSRAAYVGIFSGTIVNWNDPEIAKANPGVALPDLKIHPIMRADSSGTTYVFTKHLSAVSPEFAKSPGVNKMPNWSCGTKAKGNEGVTAAIVTTPGAIGYIEYSYAMGTKLKAASLENQSGNYVAPTTAAAQASLSAAEFDANLIAWVPDPKSAEGYPIVTYTWILLPAGKVDDAKSVQMKKLMEFCLSEGQSKSEELGYIPLPTNVVELAKKKLAE